MSNVELGLIVIGCVCLFWIIGMIIEVIKEK